MGVIRRQSAFSSVALYAGIGIGFVLSLYIYPRFLDAEEIGLVRVLVDMARLITPFLLLGMPSTFVRYYPYFSQTEEDKASFRFLSVVITGIGTMLAFALFYLFEPLLRESFADQSPLLEPFFGYLPVLIFMLGGASMMRAYYRSDLSITLPNVYESIVLKVFYASAVLLYFFLDLEVKWLVFMYFLSHTLVFIGLLVQYAGSGRLRFSRNLKRIDSGLMKEMVPYGLFVIANLIGGSMIVKIDSWMLASLSGLSAAGVYSIALSIGIIIELPKRSLTQIAVPVLASAWKNKNMQNVQDIYHKTSLNQLIAGGILFVLVWTNIDDLFAIIPNGDIYSEGKWVVFFIAISKLFAISTGCNLEILQVSEHYRYSLWTKLLLIGVAIATNLYFIPLYGITGAAIATAISFFSNNIILHLVVWFKLGLQPFKAANLYALFWLTVIFLIVYYLPLSFDLPILQMALRIALTGVLFLFVLMRFKFSDDLRELVEVGIRKVRNKV